MISREPLSSGAFVLGLRSLSSCSLSSEQPSLGTATSWGVQGLGLGLGLRRSDKEEGGEESKRVVVLSGWGSSSRRRSSGLAWVALGGGQEKEWRKVVQGTAFDALREVGQLLRDSLRRSESQPLASACTDVGPLKKDMAHLAPCGALLKESG